MTRIIAETGRYVITVGKHIGSDKALSCAFVAVSVDEPMVCGVVVAALEVIEAGFGVVVVAAIAEGVDACHGAGGCQDFAPGVIGIGRIGCAVGVDELDHISLQIEDIIVGRKAAAIGRVPECKGAAGFVVDEVHHGGDGAVCCDCFPHDLAVLRCIVVAHGHGGAPHRCAPHDDIAEDHMRIG